MPKCPEGTALQKSKQAERLIINQCIALTLVFILCFSEQISTESVCRALACHTEAQRLSLRAALVVSRGTLLLSSARSTMLGDLMR